MSVGVILSVPAAAAPPASDREGAVKRLDVHADRTDRSDRTDRGHRADRANRADTAAHDLDAAQVLDVAARYEGRPYEWGAEGPKRFDCSGYTSTVFAEFGITLPRTSSAQYEHVRPVSKQDMRRGDLVFTHDRNGDIYHVGIYAGRVGGDDLMWAATRPGDVVRLQRIWTESYLVGRV